MEFWKGQFHRQVNSLLYLHIIALMITSLMSSLMIWELHILCGKTIRVIMNELRMFSYNFACMIISDILY